MITKPITIARNEFMQAICDISNNSGLPAFVMLEVVERLKSQLEGLVQAELERDTVAYKSAMAKENGDNVKSEVIPIEIKKKIDNVPSAGDADCDKEE